MTKKELNQRIADVKEIRDDENNIMKTINEELNEAVIKGNFEKVKECLKNGANINYRHHSNTALHWAIWHKKNDIAKYLIEQGADINLKNESETTPLDGDTPLKYAVQENNVEITNILLEHGADVNAKDNYNQTALIYATICDKVDITKSLIKYGADVNVRDYDGKTALMNSCINNSLEIAKILIEKGANVNAITSFIDEKTNKKINISALDMIPSNESILKRITDHSCPCFYKNGELMNTNEIKTIDTKQLKDFIISKGGKRGIEIKPKKIKPKSKSNDFGMGM